MVFRIQRTSAACLLLGAILGLAGCGEEQQPGSPADYVIVAGDALSASAERYRDFRRESGHTVALTMVSEIAPAGLSTRQITDKIKAHIKTKYEARDPDYPFFVLLLGDANKLVPTGVYVEPTDGTANTSDNVYADFNNDHIPDLAIGRIPASSDAEVDRIRKKVADYESSYKVGHWNRRLNLIASSGGFGNLDYVIENLALLIADSMSYNFDVTMTYGSQSSEFVYVPEQFSDKVYERLNEGSLVSAYIGHGLEGSLDKLDWNKKKYEILDLKKLSSKLSVKNKAPILFIIACLTGAFDGKKEALAEQILTLEQAPPAIIASTEISHPYTNAVLALELGQLITRQHAGTVGELLQKAKYRLVKEKNKLRDSIQTMGMMMIKAGEMWALNRTHLHMYVLLGDPAMKIRHVTGKATLKATPAKARCGAKLAVQATFDKLTSGKALFTLEANRKVRLSALKAVPSDSDPGRDAAIQHNYRTANQRVAASQTVNFSGGEARVTLTVPADLPLDTYYVKVYADDGKTDAMGFVAVELEK